MSTNRGILYNDRFRFVVIGIFMLCIFLPVAAHGQDSPVEFYGESLRMNNIGMVVLGSWALANISIGA